MGRSKKLKHQVEVDKILDGFSNLNDEEQLFVFDKIKDSFDEDLIFNKDLKFSQAEEALAEGDFVHSQTVAHLFGVKDEKSIASRNPVFQVIGALFRGSGKRKYHYKSDLVYSLYDLCHESDLSLGEIHECLIEEKAGKGKRKWTLWAKEFQYVFRKRSL